jgi:glycosyltransferase involved in cell wall biosynthesis
MSKTFISIISPVYKSEFIIDELINQIDKNIKIITSEYEIILVDDCSPDNSWDKIIKICNNFNYVKGVKLSRNFGQHYAITAGIDIARGDYLIIMDCDLQDDPINFIHLFDKAKQGYDIVYTYKESRKHSFFKNLAAKIFNLIFNFLVDNKAYSSSMNIGAYSLINRKVADAYRRFNDYHRHYLLVLRWLGFSSTYIKIDHKNRYEGKSSYDIRKLIRLAIDGITSQSDKLLRIFISFGLLISILSFISILYIITLYFIKGYKSGWASTIVLILFSTGIILCGIGVIGIYLGKTFEQVKNRPKYLIDEKINI